MSSSRGDVPEQGAGRQGRPDGAAAPARYLVAIRPLALFRASERVDTVHVQQLAGQILRAGCWTTPLPVEADSGLVMDGNHRLEVARTLGLQCLPCVPLLYGDTRLDVRCWTTGRPYPADELWRTLEAHGLLPFKTTRHTFDPPLPDIEIPLGWLRQGLPQAEDVGRSQAPARRRASRSLSSPRR